MAAAEVRRRRSGNHYLRRSDRTFEGFYILREQENNTDQFNEHCSHLSQRVYVPNISNVVRNITIIRYYNNRQEVPLCAQVTQVHPT